MERKKQSFLFKSVDGSPKEVKEAIEPLKTIFNGLDIKISSDEKCIHTLWVKCWEEDFDRIKSSVGEWGFVHIEDKTPSEGSLIKK